MFNFFPAMISVKINCLFVNLTSVLLSDLKLSCKIIIYLTLLSLPILPELRFRVFSFSLLLTADGLANGPACGILPDFCGTKIMKVKTIIVLSQTIQTY